MGLFYTTIKLQINYKRGRLKENMDIEKINMMLQEGKTVKAVRESLGIPEKKFQKTVKELGYKYNQSKRLDINVLDSGIDTRDSNILPTTQTTTDNTTAPSTLTTTQTTTIDYLTDNIELLKQLLESYKRNTEANNSKDIIINLDNDKHLDPKPKSIRINEFVWRDWQEFTKDLTFSKTDLISMALKEYMEKHS